MGGCCSKSTATTTIPPPPSDHQSDLKSAPPPPPQHEKKKEIFVIKHRISHDDGTNATFNTTTSSSFKEEEFDDDNLNLVSQCGSGGGSGSRLSRSNSTTRLHNPNRKRSCRSNSSVDFDINPRFDNLYYHHDDDDDHRASRGREVSHTSSRSSSKERRISISPSRTTGRRRSESPFRSLNTTAKAGSSNPVKMVSVPATNKSSNFREEVLVKRIHVKRNVSPAKTRAADLRVYTDQHETSASASASANTDTKEADRLYYTRKSLVEIDNNAAKSTQIGKRTRKLSRDMNVETQFDPSPGPTSYASLLLEDIHKFHQNNPNATIGGTTASPAFVLPECVTKARSIMEAVADLNSKTSSLCSEDRYRNLTMIEYQSKEDKPIESGTAVNGVSASGVGDRQPSQAEPTSHDVKVRGLGGFRKDFMDYPRKGTGHGRRSAYSFPKTTTVALT